MKKPKLIFFQWQINDQLPAFLVSHRQQHVKCLSIFFDVTVINEDCDYKQICDSYEPDITLFESGVNYRRCQKIKIENTHAYHDIPKLGFHNGDSWCEARSGFLSDMEDWGIETFFSICTTTAEHTPEIANNVLVWPNFVDPDTFKDYGQTKIIPVLITGRQHSMYPWRERTNKIITENYPSLICPHLGYSNVHHASQMMHGEKYAKTINSSWFVPTCGSVEKEVVRKHFEIPACRSCLITEQSSTIEAAGFIDMHNCVFADGNNILDKLNYLFQDLEKLEGIIDAGYHLTHSRHTMGKRDQIFQWYNLNKNIKFNQKIIQENPFESLEVVERSKKNKKLYISGNGLIIELLRQADEKLFTGQYKEAEDFYLICNYHISWMPEPKLGLALCNLYRGDTKAALSWILQPIKYTLEEYKATSPDPIEWAYFIIYLLCKGRLLEAMVRAKQFPNLKHPELSRVQWVVNYFRNKDNTLLRVENQLPRQSYSVHQLPCRSFSDWIETLIVLLKACNQPELSAELMKASTLIDKDFSTGKNRSLLIKGLNKYIFLLRTHSIEILDTVVENINIENPKSRLDPLSEADYLKAIIRPLKLNTLTKIKKRIKSCFK